MCVLKRSRALYDSSPPSSTPPSFVSSSSPPYKRSRSLTYECSSPTDSPANLFSFRAKRLRTNLESDSSVCTEPPHASLPVPTPPRSHLTLRFMLPSGAWRVARVPPNYSLVHLHHLIQYLYGWSDSEPHSCVVRKGVMIITTPARLGQTKGGQPYLRAIPTQAKYVGKDPYRRVLESEWTMDHIWRESDEPRAILYTYASYTVHITLDTTSKWKPRSKIYSNVPGVLDGAGIAPNEDVFLEGGFMEKRLLNATNAFSDFLESKNTSTLSEPMSPRSCPDDEDEREWEKRVDATQEQIKRDAEMVRLNSSDVEDDGDEEVDELNEEVDESDDEEL